MSLLDSPLTPIGQFASASNAALLVWLGEPSDVPDDWQTADPGLLGVYKPQRGERPLWDFPTGTLHLREIAAYELGRAFGDLVPETVLRRDGPFGVGSLQRFVEHDPQDHYFTLMERRGSDLTRQLQQMVLFDLVVNNADRKGGHVLWDGHRVRCIDHGVTFHVEPKLRTVAWDFAGQPVPDWLRSLTSDLLDELDGGLAERLRRLLAAAEVVALRSRVEQARELDRFPAPAGPHPVPWPPL